MESGFRYPMLPPSSLKKRLFEKKLLAMEVPCGFDINGWLFTGDCLATMLFAKTKPVRLLAGLFKL